MYKIKLLIPLILIVSILTNCHTPVSKIDGEKLQIIDDYFNENVNDGKIAGAITLIAENGRVKHLKAYGYKDLEDSTLMDTKVLIPIASMTKVATSIAIMQLQEQGKLSIDDAVEKYIPAFANMKVLIRPDSDAVEDLQSKPTIRQLLNHTSGIVYSGGSSVTDQKYVEAGFQTWDGTLEEFVQKVTEIPLAYQPGTNWKYSYSHDVLGYLIEVVSGEKLNEYCKAHIFQPLKMQNTGFVVPKEKSGLLSNLYLYTDKGMVLEDDRDSSIYHVPIKAMSGGGGWMSSYGGMVTSVEDFLILSQTLLNYGEYNGVRILAEETVKAMAVNEIGNMDAYGNKYGLGLGVVLSKTDSTKTEEIFWAGSPYNTYFWIDYEDQIVSILFTNTAPFGHLGMMDKYKELVEEAMAE